MTKINAIIDRRYMSEKGTYPIKFRVLKGDNYADIDSTFDVRPDKWVDGKPASRKLQELIEETILDYHIRLRKLGDSADFMTAQDIRDALCGQRTAKHPDLLIYIKEFSKYRKAKTAGQYEYAQKKIIEYRGDGKLPFIQVNRAWLTEFQRWMGCKGLGKNAQSVVFRAIRATFNDAIANEIIPQNAYPFKAFKFQWYEHKRKEYLTLEQFVQLRDTDFGTDNDARDFWLLSFYLMGANPVDMYNCEPMYNNRIEYTRSKTGKDYSISATPDFLALCNKYKGEDHLFSFCERYQSYTSFIRFYTRKLQRIGEKMGIHLTFYHARYTFATYCYDIDIPVDIISQCLGHSGTTGARITSVYISFDIKKVDKANLLVQEYVKNGIAET